MILRRKKFTGIKSLNMNQTTSIIYLRWRAREVTRPSALGVYIEMKKGKLLQRLARTWSEHK